MSRVEVAGVEVSTEHFIGGERVGSDATFTDISPIDAQPIAEVARGGEREADLAVAAAQEAFPGWAALGATGRAEVMHRLADLIDANVERLAAVECADMAMLLALAPGPRHLARRAELPRVRRSRGRLRGARLGLERHAEPRHADAERAGGRDHPVERPVHALDLEDGPGARRGLHGDPQARGVVAALLLAALRPRRRGGLPARRLQRRAGHRRGGRRGVDPSSRRPSHLLHGLAGDGRPHRHRGGAEHRSVHRRARREGAAARLRRRRPRGRGPQGGGAVRRRRSGLPRRDASPRRGIGRGRVPRSSSTASPTSTCSATRATTRRRSRR